MPEKTDFIKASREEGRQHRLNLGKAGTEQRSTRGFSETARQGTATHRSSLRQDEIAAAAKTRVNTQKQLVGVRRNERATNAVAFGAGNSVTRSSVGLNLGMILGLFFVMIVVYVIVKNGSNFGSLTGSVGNFISGLSSNAPLFIQKPAATTTGNTVGTASKTIASSPSTGG